MALFTPNTDNKIVAMTKLLFDAAPGATYMAQFKAYAAETSLASLGDWMVGVAGSSNAAVAAKIASSLKLTGAMADEATAYALAKLDSYGAARGEAMLSLVSDVVGLQNDATWGAVANEFIASVGRAYQYSTNAANGSTDLSVLVNGDEAVLDLNLTVGQDTKNGTSGNDVFTSYIFDNQNTFQSGDRVNGGLGTDSLYAEVGDSQNFAIAAKTDSVENFFFRAQAQGDAVNAENDVAGNDISNEVQIDAQELSGVRQLWSVDSRTTLEIEDVRANSHETTIGWRNTDPGAGSNYAVYFDKQHITSPGDQQSGAVLTVHLADVLQLAKGGNGLSNFPYNGITLEIDNVPVTLAINFATVTSYTDLATKITTALAAAGYTNITASALPAQQATFSITVTDGGVTYAQNSVGGLYNPILLTNTGSGSIELIDYTRVQGTAAPSGNIVQTASNETPEAVPALTQTDVILDNVGRGSKAGDLEIGGMSLGGWSGSKGIQQFNVEVDRNSWVNEVRSTNNTLEVVNVENIAENNAAGDGDLRIDVLNDVRVFDASAMAGDVTLTANLSGNVAPKYLDIQDDQDNPAADNSEQDWADVVDTEFSYDFGSGNDTLNLSISNANLANWAVSNAVGSTTREDFELEINGGAGDDKLTLTITDEDGDTSLSGDGTHWYENSKLNANLAINAGEGNDTVRTPGSGNVIIDLGSGNDTAYLDNTGAYSVTGRKATFVFNVGDKVSAADRSLQNLQSGDNDQGIRLYKGELTVTFLGHEATVAVPHASGYTSDLQINQAIKNAINNDAVLSKLLVAKDGPANTLVVESLIDGAFETTDLDVEISVPSAAQLTLADVANLSNWYGLVSQTAASLVATMQADIDVKNASGDYETNFATYFGGANYVGLNSSATSDNIVTPDLGNDVLVLGTGEDSNDTVVYEGFNNGTDSIVHFIASGVIPGDLINTADVLVTTHGADATTGSAATFESFTLNVTGTVATAPGNITLSEAYFNGGVPNGDITVAIAAGDTAAVVAGKIQAALAAETTETWTATVTGSTVTFTSTVAGNLVDVDVSNNLGTPIEFDGSGVGMVITSVTDGAAAVAAGAAVAEVFTVTFGDAEQAASYSFGGVTVPVLAGESGENIAAAFASAGYANWAVAHTADTNVVTFTATAAGALADIVDANFVGANIQLPDGYGLVSGSDIIDFTSYDAEHVQVDGVVVTTGGAAAIGELYVSLVESSTNAGEYLVRLYEEAGATDTLVGTIGIADFGATQDFIAQNFLI